MQYTLRGIPQQLDRLLRDKARRERKSLNAAAVETLTRGLGLTHEVVRHHDLDALAGTWVEDPAFEQALELMRRVDPEQWK